MYQLYQKAGFDFKDARCEACDGIGCRFERAKPSYDSSSRTFSIAGIVLRKFVRAAWHQIEVLKRFEELSWPPRIADPLVNNAKNHLDPRYANRLKKAVSRLNHKQRYPLIRFHGHEIDRVISWELKIR
jgi:hypothetical protein